MSVGVSCYAYSKNFVIFYFPTSERTIYGQRGKDSFFDLLKKCLTNSRICAIMHLYQKDLRWKDAYGFLLNLSISLIRLQHRYEVCAGCRTLICKAGNYAPS